ncbi:MAG: NTP transferase domain-containing protein [Alteromonadaceae bacterium]|nr:NTP transferase domain-containing protein [Alteromonadaceae bacterium]
MCAVSGIQDLIEQPPHHCLGVILAGGRSSRMGKDKATVQIGQRTMLDITRSLLDAVPLNGHIVVGGDFADWTEQYRGNGPGRAICEVIANIAIPASSATAYVVFVPVDMPLLTPERLQQLIQLAKITRRAVYFNEHFLPLVVPVTPVICDSLGKLTQHYASPSVRRLLSIINAFAVTFTGAKQELSNINSPADLALLT